MHCNQCGTEAVEAAVYCHQCGAPLADAAAPQASENAPVEPTPAERFAAPLNRRDAADGEDSEEMLWQGQYSKRAMVGAWVGAGVLSLAILISGFLFKFNGVAWLVAVCAIALVWIALLLRLLYRQLSIHYYLTNQRLIHETGLLWREIDRIEAIDIDDVTFHQGPVERMLGVGRVRIQSSDQTTPEFDLVGIENVREVATMIDDARRAERRKRGLHIESV